MTLSREELTAFIDGELPAVDAARIEALLAQRPQLRAFVEKQRMLQSQMHDAFAPVIDETIPERLIAAARRSPVSWQWRLLRWLEMLTSRDFLARSALPAAAALACGLIVGVILDRSALNEMPIAPGRGGQLVAQGTLAGVLSRQLASEANDNSLTKISVSYRAKDGRYCRSFRLVTSAGVACRDPGAWTITALASVFPEPGGIYQPAGAAMPDAVRAAIRASMAGAPLDAAAERLARDRGWPTQR